MKTANQLALDYCDKPETIAIFVEGFAAWFGYIRAPLPNPYTKGSKEFYIWELGLFNAMIDG